jgi:hypothetical protein
MTGKFAGVAVNVAVTDLAAFMVTVQTFPLTISQPDHEVKVESPDVMAVIATIAAALYSPVHLETVHVRPVALTEPCPLPSVVTVRVYWEALPPSSHPASLAMSHQKAPPLSTQLSVCEWAQLPHWPDI